MCPGVTDLGLATAVPSAVAAVSYILYIHVAVLTATAVPSAVVAAASDVICPAAAVATGTWEWRCGFFTHPPLHRSVELLSTKGFCIRAVCIC